MGMIEDVLKALERIPFWKRVRETPERLDALEARVAALEALLTSNATGEACPMCGQRAMRVESSEPDPVFGEFGAKRDLMRCAACQHQEHRQRR